MNELLKRVTAERLGGDQPAAPRALGAAAIVGTVGAVVTYKLLRR
jgi:hypothetical protein